ncbi:hypothetical protein F5X96DRAFT_635373 [Biscogniauxia mediterranea]|nr:hypothetical protein F5X96DRAFT_635373 [Biscogniauxia mediterranea]
MALFLSWSFLFFFSSPPCLPLTSHSSYLCQVGDLPLDDMCSLPSPWPCLRALGRSSLTLPTYTLPPPCTYVTKLPFWATAPPLQVPACRELIPADWSARKMKLYNLRDASV